MIKSMTGYGRGQAEINGLSFSIEIKAVNHRYGDINVKAPRLLASYESEIKKRVATQLKRGKIDVFISQESSAGLTSAPVVNEAVALAYIAAFENLKKVSGSRGDISLEFLANQKDVINFKEEEVDTDTLCKCVFKALDDAIETMMEMRIKEGAATVDDINNRLDLITTELKDIEACAPRVPIEWQEKLRDRLARLQEKDGDPQRIAQEIAIFADRCDISEEISRFNSHLDQFGKLMENSEPVGRQMDFLVQELNREVNTMGSKSNDAELTRHVVTLKSELEKIREQVQNLE